MSRFRHPWQTLGASHVSGGVYWIVLPRRSRSAWAMPSSRVRSKVTNAGRIVPAVMRPVSLAA